jgi:hypothetical protein
VPFGEFLDDRGSQMGCGEMVPVERNFAAGENSAVNSDAAPLAVADDRHPKIQKIQTYWQTIHPACGLPGRQHIDPIDIPELLPNIWLMDVAHSPLRFRIRLVGTRIVAYAGEDNTGKWVHELWPDYDDTPMRQLVESRTPSWWRGPSQFRPEKSYYQLERVRLPLASDGETVDMILCLTIFYDQEGQEVLSGF